MEERKIDKMDISTEIQLNIQAEATAIEDYNRLIENLRASNLPKSQKEFAESEIYEIIGDELNHQERLRLLYSAISGIKENKD